MKKYNSWFQKLFLDNKPTIVILDALLALLAVYVFTQVAWILQPVLVFLGIVAPPIILAGILFYVTDPLVNFLESKLHIKRVISIIAIFILLLVLIIWGLLTLIPTMQVQFTSIVKAIPSYWEQVTQYFQHLIKHYHLGSQIDFNKIDKQFNTSINKAFNLKNNQFMTGTFSQLSGIINTVANTVITLITAPFLLFFMLKDGSNLPTYLSKMIPNRFRNSFINLLADINNTVGKYIQGQLTVAVCVAIIFMVGYSIIGLKYGLVVGALAGPLNLIPYIGSTIALIPALIIGATTSTSMLIKVLIVYLIEWVLETQVLSPIIMGNTMKIHPVTITLVLLAAGKMFGLVGVIFGIPGYAVIKIIVVRLFNWYKHTSELYDDETVEPAADGASPTTTAQPSELNTPKKTNDSSDTKSKE